MARKSNSSEVVEAKRLPKGQLKRLDQKITALSFPFILFSWMLIKIGQTPLQVIKVFILPFRGVAKGVRTMKAKRQRTKTVVAVTQTHVKPSRVLHLPTFHRRRGRPRTAPLRVYLHRKFHKLFKRIFPTPLRVAVGVGILILALFAYSLSLIVISRDLPSPSSIALNNSPLTTEIYDRNGNLLYRVYEGKNRTLVKLTDLPPNLINATIAIEDKNFWGHPGVDFLGMARAMISDAQGHDLQGASTLTQQLIKNTLLTTDRTWQRKVKEVLLAFWTERIYTKQQILEMYFNNVAYGGPAWGIEAASETYFHKSAKELDLAEAAYLAGLTASPTTYSPYGDHPELGKERQAEVLQRMVEDGYISKKQADQAKGEKLAFQPPTATIKAPHFVMYVRSLLADKYGERTVSQGGLKVYTSLDLGIQDMAQKVVADQIASLPDSMHITNGAAMVEDPRTGQILAMVGSKDYWDPTDGNFNITLALRQPGSSIKPITYATAFKQGYSPGTTLIDEPIVFTNPWGQSYAPVNYDGRFHGAVTIRTALASSLNIPAVKTLQMVGIPNFLQTAQDMGITTFNDSSKYGLSITLGAAEVKMTDMMTMYSTLADMGIKHDPTPILKVVDSNGEVIEDNTQNSGARALPAGVAYMLDSVLSDNNARAPEFGLTSSLYIPGHTVAAKTGTTNDVRDNWTFGFTPNYTVGVWVGNNDNSPMNQALVSGITGAAPIWNQIMTNLVENQQDISFQKPDDVTIGSVDGHQDLVLTTHPPKQTANPKPQQTITYSDQTADNSGFLANP